MRPSFFFPFFLPPLSHRPASRLAGGTFALALLLLLAGQGQAQNVATSLDEAYFQQRVDYRIQVRLDDQAHSLRGEAHYRYHNRSPDTLRALYFHAWPNAYSQPNTPLDKQLLQQGRYEFHYAADQARGFLDRLDFQQNGRSVSYSYQDAAGEIIRVQLRTPLPPGDSTSLSTPFRLGIPAVFSRGGHVGQTYQLTQWYPKPAVYDTAGWHTMPYLSIGEFFSEFGRFEVEITLPQNYLVAASGALQTPSEKAYRRQRARRSREYLEGALDLAEAGLSEGTPSRDSTKTLRFTLDSAHDFAWFASKRYLLLTDTVRLLPAQKPIPLHAFFLPDENTDGWQELLEVSERALSMYSRKVGPYIYPQATAVGGPLPSGGGMEYPGLIHLQQGLTALERVAAHEWGHQWFYAMLGSDERAHPWLDESLTSYLERLYMRDSARQAGRSEGEAFLESFTEQAQSMLYMHRSRKGLDYPVNDSAPSYPPVAYGLDVYWRGAKGLEYLERYLGEQPFEQGLRDYYRQWKGRHPEPQALQNALENRTGESLAWFFEDYLAQTRPMDFSAETERPAGGGPPRLKLQKNRPLPYPLLLQSPADSTRFLRFGIDTSLSLDAGRGARDSAPLLNPGNGLTEAYRANNAPARPRLSLLYRAEKPGLHHHFFAPVAAYNTTDGLLAGLAVYNRPFPLPRWQYYAAPMIGLESEKPGGLGGLKWRRYWRGNGHRRFVTLGLSGRRFSYAEVGTFRNQFTRLAFRASYGASATRAHAPTGRFYFDAVSLRAEEVRAGEDPNGDLTRFQTDDRDLFFRYGYRWEAERAFSPDARSPYAWELEAEQFEEFFKLTGWVKWFFPYGPGNKGLRMRWFAGYMPSNRDGLSGNFRTNMFNRKGAADYRFDGHFLGRNQTDGLGERQVVGDEGGLRYLPAGAGLARAVGDPMFTVNLESHLPGFLPFTIYADAGTYPGLSNEPNNETGITYVGGVGLPVLRGIFELYMPVVLSQDLQEFNELNNRDFWDGLHFRLALQKLSLLRWPDQWRFKQ